MTRQKDKPERREMLEAIVLAGGLGTRLRSVLPDLPKAMAPINGRPFLSYVLDALSRSAVCVAVLAVGYKGDVIREHFGARYRSLALRYSLETEPLGTGGAILQAMEEIRSPDFLVLNGDTFVEIDHAAMMQAHRKAGTGLTVATHAVADATRYGTLAIRDGRIRGFQEKGRHGAGMINAGVYALSGEIFTAATLPTSFSFEDDVLVQRAAEIGPLAFPADGVFIDIGVPEDYERARTMLTPFDVPAGQSGSPQ